MLAAEPKPIVKNYVRRLNHRAKIPRESYVGFTTLERAARLSSGLGMQHKGSATMGRRPSAITRW